MEHAYKITLPNAQAVVYAKSRGEAITKYIEQSGISGEFFRQHGTCKICTYSSVDYISPSDFEYWMRVIAERRKGDPEALHCEADELMEKVLRQLGYGKGLDIFNEQEVWYA